ncbi:hypothetical protein [Polynucleobacter necessarius]|uniref:hypothetical protein n=1 Tax=Polynucleobacter necessarius TaxID=576610 RepID=UPI000E094B86|nr:hypothetical protein [Polynucleobacter necessarius]
MKADTSLWFIQVNKKVGYRGSDAFNVQHALSDGIDFDCISNILSKDRTRKDLAFQGFIVERQARITKGAKANVGLLICQSLDSQGRVQSTTLMNDVNYFAIERLDAMQANSSKSYRDDQGKNYIA